ncbi:PEP-CTERM sorting domain-containing protein [Sphingomonas panacisoli]|uniref:PEP-CTERM sorting domain-containing protein n=1 Tax=Sphingomonas panacisoli TaxID=1813879 RepID=A0A5B8LJL1_9SPHN|nr:PEPxxWA-CTERM sorting domain-containing protein [Sphingomonas panacisoli]QDZ08373.1 PEP-CTERM sorting domain-containing protein [Sphingomonas panacisoli]
MQNKVAAAAGFAALTFVTVPASAQVAPGGDPVLYWNQIAMANIDGDPGLGGRAYAMVNIAVHDAINATMGSPDRSYTGSVANGGGDSRAAAAVAAHDVLVNLYPTKTAAFDAALTASLATIGNGSAKTTGMATGQAFASATIAARASDGFIAPFPTYTPTGQPGNYVPTTPGPGFPVDGQFATATPFVMTSPTQFRPGPPPALDSIAYAVSLNDVEAIGSINSIVRTADQTASAFFWENDPERPYLAAAIDQSLASGKSPLENARIFATLTTAIADAPITAFDAKNLYNIWRPVTAIQNADIDGNPLTTADPTWQSLLVAPPFQSYISAHSTVAGTAASILDLVYGTGVGFCATNTVGTRCWDSFDAAALDDSKSREYGGIHFSFDDQQGLASGYQLGAYAFNRNLFGAVPEPATWAMMIVGFGAIGASMRRRQSAARVRYI